MTSAQLIPRLSDLLDELKQLNNQIDYDDPAEEAMATLMNVASNTLIIIQGESA